MPGEEQDRAKTFFYKSRRDHGPGCGGVECQVASCYLSAVWDIEVEQVCDTQYLAWQKKKRKEREVRQAPTDPRWRKTI